MGNIESNEYKKRVIGLQKFMKLRNIDLEIYEDHNNELCLRVGHNFYIFIIMNKYSNLIIPKSDEQKIIINKDGLVVCGDILNFLKDLEYMVNNQEKDSDEYDRD